MHVLVLEVDALGLGVGFGEIGGVLEGDSGVLDIGDPLVGLVGAGVFSGGGEGGDHGLKHVVGEGDQVQLVKMRYVCLTLAIQVLSS